MHTGQWKYQAFKEVVMATMSDANVILLIQAAMDILKSHYLKPLTASLLSPVVHYHRQLLVSHEERNTDYFIAS